MPEITQLLDAAAAGDRQAAGALLPHVYNELRKLAAVKMVHEKSGHSLEEAGATLGKSARTSDT